MKKRVKGIGGVFFRSKNPADTRAWYQKHLGLKVDAYGTNFATRQYDNPDKMGFTQWSPMEEDTNYFGSDNQQFMINYRVENLENLVEELMKEGVQILDKIESYDYGKFVHILDHDGRRVELWEPNDENYDGIVEGRTF